MLLCDLRISPRSAVTKIANCNNNSKQRKTNILQNKETNMPKYSYGENLLMLFNLSISLYLTLAQSATNTKTKSLQTREQIYKKKKTRSSWLNCALRDDEAVYWVSVGHYEVVAVGN